MSPSVSVIPLGWTAFGMLAFHSSSSHGLDKEGHEEEIHLKGQFTPKSNIVMFPLLCSAFYPSRLF